MSAERCRRCGGSGDDLLRPNWRGYEPCWYCAGTGKSPAGAAAALTEKKEGLLRQIAALDAQIARVSAPQFETTASSGQCGWCNQTYSAGSQIAVFREKTGHRQCAEIAAFQVTNGAAK